MVMPFDLTEFLNKQFPSLTLDAGLLYRWPIGIRFELAGESPSLSERLLQATDRATALYEAAFAADEQCVVVAQAWPDESGPASARHLAPLFVFAFTEGIGLAEPEGKLEVQATEESGDDVSHTLSWVEQGARSFKYRELFRGIANSDHCIAPSISGRVYFLNPRKNVILHMYDDRGLDILATEKHSLSALYGGFSGWILDYDRARIDEIFEPIQGSN